MKKKLFLALCFFTLPCQAFKYIYPDGSASHVPPVGNYTRPTLISVLRVIARYQRLATEESTKQSLSNFIKKTPPRATPKPKKPKIAQSKQLGIFISVMHHICTSSARRTALHRTI